MVAAPTAATVPPAEPSENDLKRYYLARLDEAYVTGRIDGMAGLAHLGRSARDVAQELENLTGGRSLFEQLIACWALATINAPQERSPVEQRASVERGRLSEGRFNEVAARVAFLAAFSRAGNKSTRFLDAVLPELYSRARGDDQEDRLLAAWALHEIGTTVTRETANRTLSLAAAGMDPGHGNYTRHLLYLRMIGPPARSYFTKKVSSIIKSYDFGGDIFSKRARTVRTLAVLHYPGEPDEVVRYRKRLSDRLDSPLTDDRAVDDLLAAGPFVCSEDIVNKLTMTMSGTDDASDRRSLEQALSVCRP